MLGMKPCTVRLNLYFVYIPTQDIFFDTVCGWSQSSQWDRGSSDRKPSDFTRHFRLFSLKKILLSYLNGPQHTMLWGINIPIIFIFIHELKIHNKRRTEASHFRAVQMNICTYCKRQYFICHIQYQSKVSQNWLNTCLWICRHMIEVNLYPNSYTLLMAVYKFLN